MPPSSLPFFLAAFGPIDWAVVVIYWLAMIAIALYVGRKDKNVESFFLGRRSLPTWALAISIVGSMLSAATFVGAPDQAYMKDVSYLILNLGGIMAVFIVGFTFVPKLYHAGTVTIYGYLAQRLGESSRMAVAVMFLLGRLIASGARLFMAAIPLCLLIFGAQDPQPWQIITAICLIGVIGTFYTTLGGIRAVVWIDTIQFSLVILAVLLTIGILLYRIPLSPLEIVQVLSQPGTGTQATTSKLHLVDWSWDFTKPYTVWSALLGAVFLNVATFGVDHDFAQRFLVSKSARKGAWSVIVAQGVGMLVVMLVMSVGLLLWIFYKRPDIMGAAAPALSPAGEKEAAYPIFLMTELPPVVGGLAMAGFFAVAQGSMDSAINAMASSLVTDLWHPLRRKAGYAVDTQGPSQAPNIAVALLGALMTLFAIGCVYIYNPEKNTLLDFALSVMSFAYAGMLGVFLAALFTKRGNTWSVLAALATGIVIISLLQSPVLAGWSRWFSQTPWELAWPWHMPIATTASFLVCILGKTPSRT